MIFGRITEYLAGKQPAGKLREEMIMEMNENKGGLKKARERICSIDRKMAELFCERMDAVRIVAEYKKEHGLPILDASREADLLARNLEYIDEFDIRSYYTGFLKSVIELSKQYQHRLLTGLKIAYSGVEGAFAHIAATRIFPDGETVAYPDFPSAYEAVVSGECDCCVLPVENSFAGEVVQVTDLMFEGSLFINGIYNLRISHCLLGVEGASAEKIRTVISHPQALSQCCDYIREHRFEKIKAKNTAIAAQQVAENADILAAIASAETAPLYGLTVLDHDINESHTNTTRFAVFSRSENTSQHSRNDKFILLFTVSDVAGALAEAINVIGKYGYNMKSLRSRPIKMRAWQYYFYVEAEGDITSESGAAMIAELSEQCSSVKIVGHFSSEIDLAD